MKNEALIRNLQKTGLSEKTALVYTALLEMGGAYPSAISEKTKINRSTVYKILLDLSIKGLITEIERGKKLYYQVEKPEKLVRYAKAQADTAKDAYEKTRELIPDIAGIFAMSPNKPKIRFFQNADGIMSIFEDHVSISKKYEMLGFANTAELSRFFDPGFLTKYIKKKEKIGITTRGFVPNTSGDRHYAEEFYKGVKESIKLKVRYIPREEFPFNGEITIYGTDRVSIINFDDRGIVGIIIEDKPIHDMMTRIFELAWKGGESSVIKSK
ncbi:MAG: transcriptional regulator TrmB [Candidatus Taylorbacteria bacterium]|nr:transcriptional regulator TrmB [Candidatus Taylorbacteria bacterium]